MTDSMPIFVQIVLAVIASSPGAIALILQIKKNKQEALDEKRRADLEQEKVKTSNTSSSVKNANEVTEAALKLVSSLTSRVDEIEKDMVELRTIVATQSDTIKKQDQTIHDLNCMVRKLSQGVRRLIQQLIDNGLEPCWKPEEDTIL